MLTLGQEYAVIALTGPRFDQVCSGAALNGTSYSRRALAKAWADKHTTMGGSIWYKPIAYRRGWRIDDPWARRFKAGDLVRRRSLGSTDPKVFEVCEADPGETFVAMHPTDPNYYDPESGSWFGLCIAGTCDLVLALDAMTRREMNQHLAELEREYPEIKALRDEYRDEQRLAALAEARDSGQYRIDVERVFSLLPISVPKALAAELTERVFIMLEDPDPTDEYDPAGMLETAAEDLISVISSEWNHLGYTPAELRKEQAKAGRWRKVCREIITELNNPATKQAVKALDSITDSPKPDTRTNVEIVKAGFMMAAIWRDGDLWGAQINGVTRADFETRQARDQWVKDETGARNV